MTEPKLKPCPFCAEKGIIRIFIGQDDEPVFYVRCGMWIGRNTKFCHIRPKTKHFSKEEDAIKAWNTRAEDQ